LSSKTGPGVALTPGSNPIFRWLREPLVIFIMIGALLFGVNAWRNGAPEEPGDRQIILTEDDLVQMAAALRVQDLSGLSPEQFQNLLEVKIREEVLYREGLAMGLDVNDTIVKRRMAQKMEFLSEDLSSLRAPSEQELREWLQTHPNDFAFPPRITFQHIYFSSDERGSDVESAARAALTEAAGLPVTAAESAGLGDLFMLQDYYAERTPDQVAIEFGGLFASALFELPSGQWTGPIQSGYGWHLVFIDSLTPGRIPKFEEVQNEVRAQWTAKQRAEFKEAAYEVMRKKYEVILPALPHLADD
jgi:parvulin-like peptidyl-prolyl isomerase